MESILVGPLALSERSSDELGHDRPISQESKHFYRIPIVMGRGARGSVQLESMLRAPPTRERAEVEPLQAEHAA
jgi:hypothetical protein